MTFVQATIFLFGNIPCVKLNPPQKVNDILNIGRRVLQVDDDKCDKLIQQRHMLRDYFSIYIDDDHNLSTLPMPVDNLQVSCTCLTYFISRCQHHCRYVNL